jgi:glycine/D-amino acid oxidase-like deaminating enzyme
MKHSRRAFLLGAAATPLLHACGGGPAAPGVRVLRPGMREGHALRDAHALPAPSGELRCAVAVLGSGVAGLSAAWRLAREGMRDVLLIDGPEPDGNAAAGLLGGIACPRGAHYLPLPGTDALHVREILADLGILHGDPRAARPDYDEQALVHPAAERTLYKGVWHEGLMPRHSAASIAAGQRFNGAMAGFAARTGGDGRPAFTLPLAACSQDASLRALDRQTFSAWLDTEGHTEPSLRRYIDYAMRDDYGAAARTVSAWAGIHYFTCRRGEAANAETGAVLTWPQGLSALTGGMRARLHGVRTLDGYAAAISERRDHVSVTVVGDAGRSVTVRAGHVICAMPLSVARRIDPALAERLPAHALPATAPWLVCNALLDGFPQEKPGTDLAWDNVVHEGAGLGYVVATHQLTRVARPASTVFTTYQSGWSDAPDARRWLADAGDDALLDAALADLDAAYGPRWRARLRAAELVLRAHAMALPLPGFLDAPARALRTPAGRVLHAHADLSGLSLFEEASWWGDVAARHLLGQGAQNAAG